MFTKILIANRGEIAVRVMRTARRLGIATVAVYSDADRDALHVAAADQAFRLGPAPAAESYLNIEAILAAAKASGAEAIHPGYGFLSENPRFVEAVEAAGLSFIGPPADAIRAMGLKDAAKALMVAAGVPVVPGYHGADQDAVRLAAEAAAIGYPVLIKASAGGGGKGMRRVEQSADFAAALAGAKREAASSFGDDRVLIEKYLTRPRHIEIQVFADGFGHAVHLFERDCSAQRRHQKVIEEAPAPGMSETMRAAMGAAAVKAATAIGYRGAGTVEFIADVSEGLRDDRFFFMEMNTRLQVEHPVTEMITGLDLVEWQLRVAAGEKLPLAQHQITRTGHAFEARIYAEDPAKGFLPQTGRLGRLDLPSNGEGIRVDAGVRTGDVISLYYDPMIAKLIVHADTRAAALAKLGRALAACHAGGVVTNIGFLGRLAAHTDFASGDIDTGVIERNLASLTVEHAPPGVVIALAGLQALGLIDPPAGADPWGRLKGWRLWGDADQFAHLDWGGERRDVPVSSLGSDRFEVRIDGAPFAVQILGRDGDSVRVDCGDRIVAARVLAEPDRVTVVVDGHSHTIGLTDQLAAIEAGDDGDDRIRAPMPGLVTAVHVAVGALVEKGDALIVTEAMKMEHTMVAGRAGRVVEVNVQPGDRISEGTVLVLLGDN